MKKMGLFGGSFDPIHQGHIDMALRLIDRLGLDGVWLMPTFVPPHKIRASMAAAEHRLAMCRLATRKYPQIQVSDLELQRQGASFTVDTLSTLCEQHPDTEWYLITGADMFTTLRTWHRFEDVARMAVLCTVPRAGTDTTHLQEYAAALEADDIRCYVDDQTVLEVSSTEIRRRIMAGESTEGLLPLSVTEYIHSHGLYQRDEGMQVQSRDEQFIAIIRSRLSDYRFRHSLCVAEEARRLAVRYGADPDKAYTAGILHDIMKDTATTAQQKILDDYGVELDNVEKNSTTLWHARTGAVFLRHILGIEDEDILHAVRYHTTGRAGMSLLEKVLFVADFTSADRDYPDVDVMRRHADQSLSDAMLYGVDYTIRELIERGNPVHPDTVALYNDIVLSLKNGGQTNEQ